jgi:small subunit ribosomal protein S3
MGQKINPTSMRLGITDGWRSRWFARKKEFGKNLVEDQKLRKFIKKNYYEAGISKIEIERMADKVTVLVHAASPGLVIGRRGSKVDKLTEDLQDLVGKPVDLKIIEIEEPELSAQLVAESVAAQLEKRASYRRAMRKAVESVMSLGAKGVKIQVSGRIGGAEIARTEDVLKGRMPLTTLRAVIDYALAEALISKGKIGIKVWIFKGEQLPHTEAQKNEVNAKQN